MSPNHIRHSIQLVRRTYYLDAFSFGSIGSPRAETQRNGFVLKMLLRKICSMVLSIQLWTHNITIAGKFMVQQKLQFRFSHNYNRCDLFFTFHTIDYGTNLSQMCDAFGLQVLWRPERTSIYHMILIVVVCAEPLDTIACKSGRILRRALCKHPV